MFIAGHLSEESGKEKEVLFISKAPGKANKQVK